MNKIKKIIKGYGLIVSVAFWIVLCLFSELGFFALLIGIGIIQQCYNLGTLRISMVLVWFVETVSGMIIGSMIENFWDTYIILMVLSHFAMYCGEIKYRNIG